MRINHKRMRTRPMAETMLVRIHEPQPNHGYHMETYILSGSGYPKFDWRLGWYEVDAKTALALSRVKNNPGDPYSRLAFQVVTPEEAEAMEEAEKEVAATADAPHPMPKKIRSKLAKEGIVDVVDRAKRRDQRKVEVEGWDEEDDEIPDAEDEDAEEAPAEKWRSKGPIETADEDDLAELEEYERQADLTTAELREGTTAIKPVKRVSKKAEKKATKKVTKKTAKKKATKVKSV